MLTAILVVKVAPPLGRARPWPPAAPLAPWSPPWSPARPWPPGAPPGLPGPPVAPGVSWAPWGLPGRPGASQGRRGLPGFPGPPRAPKGPPGASRGISLSVLLWGVFHVRAQPCHTHACMNHARARPWRNDVGFLGGWGQSDCIGDRNALPRGSMTLNIREF